MIPELFQKCATIVFKMVVDAVVARVVISWRNSESSMSKTQQSAHFGRPTSQFGLKQRDSDTFL